MRRGGNSLLKLGLRSRPGGKRESRSRGRGGTPLGWGPPPVPGGGGGTVWRGREVAVEGGLALRAGGEAVEQPAGQGEHPAELRLPRRHGREVEHVLAGQELIALEQAHGLEAGREVVAGEQEGGRLAGGQEA